jgi:serine/threonine protein kinase
MLTGTVPFEAEGALATALKHVTDQPVPPRERDPSVPEALDALVMGLLAKDPETRHASAFELAEDLRKARTGLPLAFVAGAARHPDTQQAQAGVDGGAHSDDPGREPQSSRKRPVAIGLLAMATLLMALGTFGWGLTGSREEPHKGVGAVAASEGGKEGKAPAAPGGSEDGRAGSSGKVVGSGMPSVELAGGAHVPAPSSAPQSAAASASVAPASSSAPPASASTSASASPESAPASASATPDAQSSPAAQEGPSGSGGKVPGTTNTVIVESAAQEQYR